MVPYLDELQCNINDGLNFLKKKILDPEVGLETKVKSMETTLYATDAGLCDIVSDLEGAIEDPVSGLKPRVTVIEQAFSKVQSIPSTKGNPTLSQVAAEATALKINDLQIKVNDLEGRLATTEFQSQVVLHWADTMFSDHKSLQRQVNFNTAKHHTNELIIGGIYETKNSNCKQEASKFLHDKLEMAVIDSDIIHAKRIGKKGKVLTVEVPDSDGALTTKRVQCPRRMVVKCTPQFKAAVLAKKKMLSGVVDPQGFTYFIAPFLTDPFKANFDKNRDDMERILQANEKKQPQDQTSVRISGTELLVNNKLVRGFVHPPSPGDVCNAQKMFRKELNSYDLLKTKPLNCNGSTFQGFAVPASNLLAVFLSYCKVRIEVPKARHIMCAYRVGDMVDSCDDGEHHGGLQISRALQKAQINNVCFFVSRITGPEQLGPKRFEQIRKIVDELFQILNNSTVKQPVNLGWGASIPSLVPARDDSHTVPKSTMYNMVGNSSSTTCFLYQVYSDVFQASSSHNNNIWTRGRNGHSCGLNFQNMEITFT